MSYDGADARKRGRKQNTPDIFLCHSTEDKDFVRPLVVALKNRGLAVWIDDDLPSGVRIWQEIDAGISASRHVVVILSPSFFAKDAARQELDAFLSRMASIIPVRHGMSVDAVKSKSPLLGARLLLSTDAGTEHLADEIATRIRGSKEASAPEVDCILCVGSAVGETLLTLDQFQIGSKNLGHRQQLLGGSGYNHTCRLLSMGFPVVPILSVGKDLTGERIQASLLDLLSRLTGGKGHRIIDFVKSEAFFCPGFETVESTIAVCGLDRTIVTGAPPNPAGFHDFLVQRLNELDCFGELNVRAVMIGHIYADSKTAGKARGRSTKLLIEKFRENVLFANFGQSQIELGYAFWRDIISQLGVFQLSIEEMRAFFTCDKVVPSLPEIIGHLHEIGRESGTNGVITLDKFGAIATCGHKPKAVYIAWPHDLANIVDTTGAGDAFGAGLIASMCSGNHHLADGLERASLWAAYACTSLGAANACPTPDDLRTFESSLPSALRGEMEVTVQMTGLREIERTLWLFDRAYRSPKQHKA
jgi:sugar/nucleoside kinase (ribokinase family)